MSPLYILMLLILLVLASSVKVFREYERAVVFRLGRIIGEKGPGIFLIIPFVDRIVKVSLRIITLDVPTQDIITKDNVSIKVNAVILYRVLDPNKAIVEVEDYLYTTSQLAQTTLRSIVGMADLDDLLSARDKINRDLQKVIDEHTDPWGIKVVSVEVKHVDLPPDMQRAMAKQAEAERERRAKIIHAQGEYQAAEKLAMAAEIISKHPQALQLRYLQTLSEIASENNSTTIFPLPMDMIEPFLRKLSK